MRSARLKLNTAATYHVMSRILEGKYCLGQDEKGYLANLMRRLEVFTGCEVRTYAFLDNHFHVLLHVPEYQNHSDEEVKWRVRMLYGEEKYKKFEKNWELWIEQGQEWRFKEHLDSFRARMYDLSEFMKTFKQRFTVFYNATKGHKGPTWWGRFKSVLVEDNDHALQIVAAYIDLNPVRAGKVNDPKDYLWSGYGEAVAGTRESRKKICKLFSNSGLSQNEAMSEYRKFLYVQGEMKADPLTGVVVKPGFLKEQVEKVISEDGKIPVTEILRCKVRYFSDGAVIGSSDFVRSVFKSHSDCFCPMKSRCTAKSMKFADWGGLFVAKGFRLHIVTVKDGL